jgi:hypothetical protein
MTMLGKKTHVVTNAKIKTVSHLTILVSSFHCQLEAPPIVVSDQKKSPSDDCLKGCTQFS